MMRTNRVLLLDPNDIFQMKCPFVIDFLQILVCWYIYLHSLCYMVFLWMFSYLYLTIIMQALVKRIAKILQTMISYRDVSEETIAWDHTNNVLQIACASVEEHSSSRRCGRNVCGRHSYSFYIVIHLCILIMMMKRMRDLFAWELIDF